MLELINVLLRFLNNLQRQTVLLNLTLLPVGLRKKYPFVVGAPCHKSTSAKSYPSPGCLTTPCDSFRGVSVPTWEHNCYFECDWAFRNFPRGKFLGSPAPWLYWSLSLSWLHREQTTPFLLEQTFIDLKAISMSCFSSLFRLKNLINLPQTMFLSPSLHPHQVADTLSSRVLSGRVLQPRRTHWCWAAGPNPSLCLVGCNPPCTALWDICLSLSTAFFCRNVTRRAASHPIFVLQVIPSSEWCFPLGLPEPASVDHISNSPPLHSNSDLICTWWTSHHNVLHRHRVSYCQDCQEHRISYVKRFRKANPPAVCKSKTLGRWLTLHRSNTLNLCGLLISSYIYILECVENRCRLFKYVGHFIKENLNDIFSQVMQGISLTDLM